MHDLSLQALLATQKAEHDEIINELVAALKWMIDNDETNEGDEPLEHHGGRCWNEINAYWIDGLNRARAAVSKAESRT
ncbi:MAG: hypothetical protein H5U22_06600 [Rhizobium sp.]|nr:hypothetical protein [Rhizobium sp.]